MTAPATVREARLALVPLKLQNRTRVEVLAAVVDKPGIRVGAVASRLGVSSGTVSDHVSVLAAGSLIREPASWGPAAGALHATPEGVRWLWFAQQVIR